ncbi:hypothetical protein LTR84_011975 [Exophiala bonariae]|uniref:Fungal N-terminal domain-containing protein n=1 Tax=Exophiala bonariae TaxID=1690606 RepID=A0AAV9MRV3_9EURO|nr:hypothetical protein LTR84_011975 [Exophiala bonariae]
MEVVSAFSAILTIATEFNHIYKRLHRCLRTLKYAREDIKAIRDEVEIFSNLLCMFHRTITDARLADEGLSAEIKASKMAQGIVRSGKAALIKIEDILDEVEPLRADKAYPTLAQWIARWKWSTRKEEWTLVQISLNSIKQSANLLISMVYFQDLVHKLDKLRAGERTIPNEMLQQLSVVQFHRVLSKLWILIAT